MGPYVCVIGGINLDVKGVPAGTFRQGTSNPGTVYTSAGGVGRNIAHNLALLGIPVVLFGVVGDDAAGGQLVNELCQVGVNIDYVRVVEAHQTGMYLSILNEQHDLVAAVSGMAIMDFLDTAYLDAHCSVIQRSRFVMVETNVHVDVLEYIVTLCHQAHIPCLVEPVSIEKSLKILDVPGTWEYMTPNSKELAALSRCQIRDIDDVPVACASLSCQSRYILLTLGENGVYVHENATQTGRFHSSYQTKVVDSTGAGDAFVAGFVSAVVRNYAQDESIRIGIAAACLTLQSEHTVNPHLSFEQCLAFSTYPNSPFEDSA